MAGIEQFLAKRLELKVNKAKSAVAPPRARKLPGSSFTIGKRSSGASRLRGLQRALRYDQGTY